MDINNIQIDPRWDKSKEDVWDEAFANLSEDEPISDKKSAKKIILYAIASAAAILILLPCFAFFYTKNITVPRGEHATAMLPDDSKVELNAESVLSYKPLWWYVSRQVEMEGEAYFEVTKGSTFEVFTEQYTVKVLGTSFNIIARQNNNVVTCLTGKVNVSNNNSMVDLTPNMAATYVGNIFNVNRLKSVQQSIIWTENKFVFIGAPLTHVIEEIERQYDINVRPNSNLNYLYTGNFSMSNSPREVLEIVGKPFDIQFEIE